MVRRRGRQFPRTGKMSLEGKKLLVATPMYGGLAHAGYIASVLELKDACHHAGVPMSVAYLYNESLITRGRNKLVQMFLESQATHLLFADADVKFDPRDALAMLRLDLPVVGGGYSKKSIQWGRVAEAVRAGAPVETLPFVACSPCFNLQRAAGEQVPLHTPVEVPRSARASS